MTDYVNTPAGGQVRRPRAMLMLGDTPLQFERMSVSHSGTHQAGTLQASLRAAPGSDVGQWAWWLAQGVIVLDAYVGFPADPANYTEADLTRLCTVRIDSLRFDPAANAIDIEGRDLSALLIDAKTSGQFQNQTSSQVAQQFATSAGLDAQIQATTTKIGTYYHNDFVQIQHEQSQWALLTYLARKEGYDCHVLGRTLYFGKFANPKKQSYLIRFEPNEQGTHKSNAVRLDFEHDLTLARDVVVTIRSHNPKTGKAYTATARSSGGKVSAAKSIQPPAAGSAQTYAYVEHAMASDAAKKLALQRVAEISKHELRLGAVLPGDDLLYPWVPLEVQGTGTILDATYYIDEIRRDITPDDFTMTVQAKNHPTATEAALA